MDILKIAIGGTIAVVAGTLIARAVGDSSLPLVGNGERAEAEDAQAPEADAAAAD